MTSTELRDVAAQLGGCVPLRSALIRCGRRPDASEPCRRLSRLLAMGVSLGTGIALALPDTPSVRCALEVASRTGAEPGRVLSRLADVYDQADARAADAHAATAGMVLSSRIVTCLPVVTFPLLGGSVGELADPVIVLILAAGIFLAWCGARTLARLVPRPPLDPFAAVVAEIVAAAVRSGAAHGAALNAAAASADGPDAPALQRAAARVKLGVGWAEALLRSDDGDLVELGRAVGASLRQGTPVAPSLERAAGLVRDRARAGFEAEVRRAPVRMAVPLALLVLPSFAFLGLGPLLASLGR